MQIQTGESDGYYEHVTPPSHHCAVQGDSDKPDWVIISQTNEALRCRHSNMTMTNGNFPALGSVQLLPFLTLAVQWGLEIGIIKSIFNCVCLASYYSRLFSEIITAFFNQTKNYEFYLHDLIYGRNIQKHLWVLKPLICFTNDHFIFLYALSKPHHFVWNNAGQY